MMIKGSCQKQDLMQAIHDAILSPGSNWTEISSNKTNDYLYNSANMTDGWVFKSPPIGDKQQNIFMTLKSQDLSLANGQAGVFYIWLSDSYMPNDTSGQNGTYENKSVCNLWIGVIGAKIPATMYDYFIDIQDHRILIVIQLTSTGTVTNPCFLYVGYPELNTNLEGTNYTNQFILGNATGKINSYYGGGLGFCYWHKNCLNNYNAYAKSICNLNNSNPIPTGAFLLSPIYITGDGCGAGNPGPLGVLSGLYGMPNTSIVNGDIITIGSDTYQVFILYIYNVSISLYGASGYYYNNIPLVTIAIKTNN